MTLVNLHQEVSLNFIDTQRMLIQSNIPRYHIFCLFCIKLHTDICLTLPCGVNAKCETMDDKFECSCPSGLTGDPKIKCEGNKDLKRKDIEI